MKLSCFHTLILIFALLLVLAAPDYSYSNEDNQELSQAGISQQQAISSLVSAIKEYRKALMDMAMGSGGGAQEPPDENPFKDKHEYKKPKLDPAENPENQLAKFQEEQNKIIDAMDKSRADKEEQNKDHGQEQQMKSQDAQKGQGQGEGQGESKEQNKDQGKEQQQETQDGQQQGQSDKQEEAQSGQQGQGGGQLPDQQANASGDQSQKQTGSAGSTAKNEQGNKSDKTSGGGNGSDSKTDKEDAPMTTEQMADAQTQISSALKKLAGNPDLSKDLLNTVSNAMQSSRDVEQALLSQEEVIAKVHAEKTVADIREAINELRKQSSEQAAETLADVQKAANRAKHALDQGKADEAARQLNNMIEKLGKSAVEQHKGGSQETADMLSRLAEELSKKNPQKELEQLASKSGDKTRNDVSTKIENMRQQIEKARTNGMNRKEQLSRAMDNFKDLSKELKYLGKQSGTMNRKEIEDLLADMELAMQDIELSFARYEVTGSSTLKNKTGYLSLRIVINEDKIITSDAIPAVLEDIADLLAEANKLLASQEPGNLVRAFDPAEVPEKYRSIVSKYFERLSDSSK